MTSAQPMTIQSCFGNSATKRAHAVAIVDLALVDLVSFTLRFF